MADEQEIDAPKAPARDENGRLLPGNTANPSGENGMRGFARYADRVNYWLDRLTVGELQDLVTDPKKMREYSVRDGQIIVHIARTMTGKDIGKERDRLLNRTEGMPVQTIINREETAPLPKDIDAVDDAEAERYHEQMLKE